MGLSLNNNSSMSDSHYRTHKIFLLCNFILLGAASSCIFLTLSLRLIPSICGVFLILLHILTIAGAVSGCTAVSAGSNRWYGAHMVATVLTAIFQGSVSEDGSVILKLAGGLCILMFCLEWVVLALAFVLKYYAYVEGNNGGGVAMKSGKVRQEEDLSNWPWPFQV
ncbi:hypothetical protein NMG60_11028145 [Bertholletia excelsa]